MKGKQVLINSSNRNEYKHRVVTLHWSVTISISICTFFAFWIVILNRQEYLYNQIFSMLYACEQNLNRYKKYSILNKFGQNLLTVDQKIHCSLDFTF